MSKAVYMKDVLERVLVKKGNDIGVSVTLTPIGDYVPHVHEDMRSELKVLNECEIISIGYYKSNDDEDSTELSYTLVLLKRPLTEAEEESLTKVLETSIVADTIDTMCVLWKDLDLLYKINAFESEVNEFDRQYILSTVVCKILCKTIGYPVKLTRSFTTFAGYDVFIDDCPVQSIIVDLLNTEAHECVTTKTSMINKYSQMISSELSKYTKSNSKGVNLLKALRRCEFEFNKIPTGGLSIVNMIQATITRHLDSKFGNIYIRS